MRINLSPRLTWIIGIIVALVAVYAIAGFFIAPGIVRGKLARQVSATLHRPAAVGPVRVNPFSLSVTVDSLRVADKDGAMLFAWDEFYINFELISVLRREADFKEVRLVRPYGRMVIRRDGSLNVTDIVDSMKAAPSSGPAPVVSIDALHIVDARLDVVDSATGRPFATTIGPWRIDLAAFATRRDNNSRYSFSGRTESGESFAWAGTLGTDPLRSAGEFSLDSLKLPKYGPFYERTVAFNVVRGIAGIKAKYDVDFTPQARKMQMSGGELRVGDLAIVERGRTDTAVRVRELVVGRVSVDALARKAYVGEITSRAGVLNALRNKDSTINVMRLMVMRSDSGAALAKASAPAKTPAPWRWLIAHVAADSYAVNFIDSSTAKPAVIAITNASVTFDSIANDSARVSPLHATATWAPNGALKADGSIAIWKHTGDLAVSARAVSLRPFDPYGKPAMNLVISDGRLATDARITYNIADSLHPDFTYKGDLRIERFATVDGKDRLPFLSFSALRFTGVDYAYKANKLTMKEIRLDDPSVVFRIAEDGRSSMSTIFPRSGGDSARADSTVAHDSAPPPPKTVAAHPASGAGSRSQVSSAAKTSIGRIKITNGSIALDDKSLQPAVAFSVTKINAVTGRLSSDSLGTGTLDLTASVDNVAPVKITGSFNPLSDKEGSDLTVDLQGMELIPVGPYSGKYLGYLISKGKMKVEMKYRVVGRQLKSENKLTLDEFTFGDQTNSPEATKMPVKLGFAIMRDRNGQIVFDVPIEGNLDDPDFHFGRVIGRAILNVLTKLITSPFKLLGGMFGAGANVDLSYAEFAEGSSTLSASEVKKMDVLAKSLYERPALKLEIAGAVDTVADPAALKAAKLEAQFRLKKWTALKAKDPNTPPVDSVMLTVDERAKMLTAAFDAAFPADSAVAAAKKSKSAAPPYPAAEMERRLLATIVISPDDLHSPRDRARQGMPGLPAERAGEQDRIRESLSDGGIDQDGWRAGGIHVAMSG